jgi:hypothetical protein
MWDIALCAGGLLPLYLSYVGIVGCAYVEWIPSLFDAGPPVADMAFKLHSDVVTFVF